MVYAFLFFALTCLVDQDQPKTYRFIGRFQEYDTADGYFWYKFAGASGKTKTFMQAEHWQPLTYNFQRIDLNLDKWFEITYYGVYGTVGDDEEKTWFRRIKSIKLVPIPGTKLYRFTGKFRSASILEGSGYYTFIGLNGRPKDFAHDNQWSQNLPYDFFDAEANTNELHIDKWFRITYYGVYGVLSGEDGASKRWYRKIYTIEMIPIPLSKDVAISDTSRLIHFSLFKGMGELTFQDGPDTDVLVKCDTSKLAGLGFDFTDAESFDQRYHGQQFEFEYRIEYRLETESPVTRRITSLKLLN